MSLQILTLTLDGITAGDYLTWSRDPRHRPGSRFATAPGDAASLADCGGGV